MDGLLASVRLKWSSFSICSIFSLSSNLWIYLGDQWFWAFASGCKLCFDLINPDRIFNSEPLHLKNNRENNQTAPTHPITNLRLQDGVVWKAGAEKSCRERVRFCHITYKFLSSHSYSSKSSFNQLWVPHPNKACLFQDYLPNVLQPSMTHGSHWRLGIETHAKALGTYPKEVPINTEHWNFLLK